MIVIVGTPVARRIERGIAAGGIAAGIARAVALAGRPVQLIARVPDDSEGDAVLQELATAGVGHVATLRQPPGATGGLEAADLALGLRYLAEIGVVVVIEMETADVVTAAVEAAAWSDAALVVVLRHGSPLPDDLPAASTVFEAPVSDPEDAFARLVAGYVAALDAGTDAASAFRGTLSAVAGWTPT